MSKLRKKCQKQSKDTKYTVDLNSLQKTEKPWEKRKKKPTINRYTKIHKPQQRE